MVSTARDTALETPFDLEAIRAQFPALDQEIRGSRLVYLDNAATAQTPRAVIDAITNFYEKDCSNIHRGVHTLSARATEAYENARADVARFIGAPDPRELVFVRGTTEAINLVAYTWGQKNIGPGDEILVTELEHHSNIVPWQMLAERTGATLRYIPINERGELDFRDLDSLLTQRTRLLAFAHVSNALGTITPVAELVTRARAVGAKVLIDGAQSAPHMPVNVAELDCDFYALSGHKLYGPMGIGALWVRQEILDSMPPFEGGGGMIRTVSFDGTTYAPAPERFEAGTPNVSGAIGLGAACNYLDSLGMANVATHEATLLVYAEARLAEVDGVRIIGEAADKAGVTSFLVDGVHPHDLGTILDGHGVAIRAGHHCAQPVMDHFGIPATARASWGIYNGRDDVDGLLEAIAKARKMFGL